MKQHEEKAKELFMYHLSLIAIATKYPDNNKLYKEHRNARRQQAKDHTIKTVDEILDQYIHISAHLSPDWCNKQIKFLQKVKESINKM